MGVLRPCFRIRCRTTASFVLMVCIVTQVLGAVGSTQESKAQRDKPQDQPAPAKVPKASLPPKPPPPNEPPPEDGGPLAYSFTPDEAIALFAARVAKNPDDFISHRYLGELYVRKARETGDHAVFAQAEESLRKALALAPDYTRAQSSLAVVLCSRHRFHEGLEFAREVVRKEPRNLDAHATVGDALLGLGRYDEAEAAFATLQKLADVPEVWARQSRLAEIKGDLACARELMGRAAHAAAKRGGTKQAAWYRLRQGDLAFESGRLEEAEAFYALVPEGVDAFHDAMAGLGRVREAQGRLQDAIALYERAVAVGPDPSMLSALGDLYLEVGQSEKAQTLFDQLVRTTKDTSEDRRSLALFLVEHDRDLPRALELAQRDFAERPDIYGRDLLAWALFKNGRFDEADSTIAQALKVGTKDARVLYHTGMISMKRGNKAQARAYLEQALSVNPHFDRRGAKEARAALAALVNRN